MQKWIIFSKSGSSGWEVNSSVMYRFKAFVWNMIVQWFPNHLILVASECLIGSPEAAYTLHWAQNSLFNVHESENSPMKNRSYQKCLPDKLEVVSTNHKSRLVASMGHSKSYGGQ